MIASKPYQYYGKTVINYTSLNGQSNWKIFYSNGTNIFLITGDYVQNSKINKTATKMSTGGTYRAWWELNKPVMQTVTDETKTLFMATGYTLNSSKNNSKCVSTFLNTNNWNKFLDNENGTGKAKAAIATPTIEMWVKSWNNLYKNVDGELFCNKTNDYGYYVGTSSSPITEKIEASVMKAKKGYQNKLYYPYTSNVSDGSDNCSFYWLASPSTYGNDYLREVNYGGALGYNTYRDGKSGLRPVVALNSGITVDARDS